MRLKQLLGSILLAAVATAMATASVSQLSGVLVKTRDNAGVVTILANGTFTHTEYRPADNLMLVDLAGVSITHEDGAAHVIYAPGLHSYRILAYRSAAGTETARIELSLVAGAKVDVVEIASGLELRVTGAPAVVPSREEIAAKAANREKAGPMSQIRGIAVSRGHQGLNIEITGSHPLTGKTMKLTGPDRIVLDIPDSVLEGRQRDIAVNANGVKGVRAARYQSNPPITRVVVDLLSLRDFDVVPEGNKLILKLNDVLETPTGSPAIPVMPAAEAAASVLPKTSASVATKTVAAGNVPTFEAIPDSTSATSAVPVAVGAQPAGTLKTVAASPSRADLAAAHFAHDIPNVPSINQAPYDASLAAKPAAINAALQQQTQAAPGYFGTATTGCTSGRYTGEPIGLNFKDLDLKDFFRVIQEISGLNVVLDPAVKGTVSIYLNDVPWDQALAIVLQNNGLECQLQGNVLRIATLETLKNEAEARRAQQEAQALAVPKETITRYLSYGQSKDAAPIVKKFLSARGDVVADPRSNALIIEDIPATLPKVDDLIRKLDRKTPEVEIEARVVAATRTFARDIGTQIAPGFAQGHSAIGGAGVGDSSIVTTGVQPPTSFTIPPPATQTINIGPTTGNLIRGVTPGTIPLFTNLAAVPATSGLAFSTFTQNFRLDFFLTLAESRGLLKVLSRPRVVTQNNIEALVRQGVRVPVVTQSQLGGPPTVQFIDAFLRLKVTPQITAENTIFLNVDVENTIPDFSRTTGNQPNPVLNTQQATTNVLVTDGGTVVIGGVVQTQNNSNVAQTPLLGSIPILGNLFRRTTVSTSTQELIFFITPKIIQT
jgi:type IV pilus assembly protein PilQ